MGTAKPAVWKEVQGTAGTEEVGCTEWERGRERRKLGERGRCLDEGDVVVDEGPCAGLKTPRSECVRQRGWLSVPLRHLLADYGGIYPRSVICAVGVVRRIRDSQRP
jgi:hypothetical protein